MQENASLVNLNIDLLTPNPYQPRKTFNESTIKELAESIKTYGIINPILVRKQGDIYQIIAGERRWRAAKSLNLPTVPVIIKDLDDQKMAEVALIENLQRENLNSIEEAESIKQILDLTKMNQNELGALLGKSQSTIANKLRLLTLPKEIQEALINKKISERHARSLLNVENPTKQTNFLKQIIDNRLTVKDLDELIKKDQEEQDEIEMTISDIMKSLKDYKEDNTNEKEEKESDNMNNGNFFPNFNSQINPNLNNNNTSLNSLNMQSMNEPMAPAQETVMPTQNITPSVEPANVAAANPFINFQTPAPTPVAPAIEPQMPSIEQSQQVEPLNTPIFNNTNENPIPDFTSSIMSNPAPATPEVSPTPAINSEPTAYVDTPLFNSEINNQPVNTPVVEPTTVQEPTTFVDTPLFSTSKGVSPINNEQPVPTPEPYEVPVTSTPVPEDKLTKTTNFLNQEGIQYKLYSNETNHCIIIEI